MKNKKTKKGFTLVELLVALAITALIITSVAFAISASAKNYNENEDLFLISCRAQQALSRLTTHLRTAMVDPTNIGDTSSCTLLFDDGSSITYHYDADSDELYVQEGGNDYLLCNNITAMTIIRDNSTPSGDVKSVQVMMTLTCGNTVKTFSAAAAIRKVIE